MIDKILLWLYIGIGLIPNLGASDKSETQVFYLAILNLAVICCLFYKAYSKENRTLDYFKESISTSYIIFFLMFLICSVISLIKSINVVESLRALTFLLNYFIAFINIYILLKEVKIKKFIVNIVVILFSIELLASYLPYIIDYVNSSGNIILRSQRYSGLTGNVNIASFSLLMKLPIILYVLIKTNSFIKKGLCSLLLFLSAHLIFSILITRAAILSYFIIVALFIVYLFFRRRILIKDFLLIILPLVLTVSFNFFNLKEDNFVNRINNITTENDRSTAQRIDFWQNGLSEFINNPFLGVGIGNWKITSSKDYLSKMKGYVVPYHPHNDFIEIAAETGIFGLLFFSLLLLYPIFVYLKKHKNESVFLFVVFLSLLAYLFDSFVNFPLARPIQVISLGLILAAIFQIFEVKRLKLPLKNIQRIVIPLILILIPFLGYSSYRLYKSSVEQFYLLGSFNNPNIKIEELSDIDQYQDTYPNIAATTIPLKALKGIIHLKNKNLKKAKSLFYRGMKDNPYIPINETYLGYLYYEEGKKDSALYFSKIAFEKQYNNPIHFAHYMVALNSIKDTASIKKAYLKIKNSSYKNSTLLNKIYAISIAGLLEKDETKEYINVIEQDMYQKDDPVLKANLYILNFGFKNARRADLLNTEGNKYFENKQYDLAAQSFSKAAELNPLELPS